MKAKVQLKRSGVRELLHCDGVRRELERQGNRVLDKANSNLGGDEDGYELTSQSGNPRGTPWGRWRVSVTATSRHAKRHEAKHDTLVRLLSGGA